MDTNIYPSCIDEEVKPVGEFLTKRVTLDENSTLAERVFLLEKRIHELEAKYGK